MTVRKLTWKYAENRMFQHFQTAYTRITGPKTERKAQKRSALAHTPNMPSPVNAQVRNFPDIRMGACA